MSSIHQDAEQIIDLLRRKHLDEWVQLDVITTEFGWGPGAKTYKRMSAARDIAGQSGMCLTFATWRHGCMPVYMLTQVMADAVVPGLGVRARAASTQWHNIGLAGGFVERKGRDGLTRKIGRLARETAEANARQQATIAGILGELEDKHKSA